MPGIRTSEIIMLNGWARRVSSARAGIHRHSLEALALQKRMEQAALTGVVVHDENAGWFHNVAESC
jgi:hypothetical protein